MRLCLFALERARITADFLKLCASAEVEFKTKCARLEEL
jgi:hypothetical protein